ncbi:MAG: hypothetical protein Q8Q91_01425, partial [Candidatus Daviesbacteria bacterium]|nr:hypothetical protein [Candidatus Daviesbacteria bacterium]
VASATLFWSLMRRLEKQYRETAPDACALKSHIRYPLFNPILIRNHEDQYQTSSRPASQRQLVSNGNFS